MFAHVDQARVFLDSGEDLSLSVHHVLVFEDLFDCDDLARLDILSLRVTNERHRVRSVLQKGEEAGDLYLP